MTTPSIDLKHNLPYQERNKYLKSLISTKKLTKDDKNNISFLMETVINSKTNDSDQIIKKASAAITALNYLDFRMQKANFRGI